MSLRAHLIALIRFTATICQICFALGPERLHAQQHIAIRVPMCRGGWNLLPSTGVVEPAVEIPDRRFGGGRARCDQFSGQPWRLHRAECRPVYPRCDRKHDCANAVSGGVPRGRRPDDLLRASGDSAAPSRSGCSCLKRGESKGRLEAENAPAPAGYTPHNHTNTAPSHQCARSVLYRSDGSARYHA